MDQRRSAVPGDPLAWRPQQPMRVKKQRAIQDPLIEPYWDGHHVLLHFDAGDPSRTAEPSVRLVDVVGDDATNEEPDVVAELRTAVMAYDAVIDGFLTSQATRTGSGASIAMSTKVPNFPVLAPRDPDVAPLPLEGHDRGGLVAFVAVDILRLDGQDLFDVPLLERKRLLEGVVQPTDLVRISVYTRPPLGPWLASWKGSGFSGAVMKAANRRYRPGGSTDEWTVVTRMPGGRRFFRL